MLCFVLDFLFVFFYFFFFQAEDGIRDRNVTGVQTCALPIFASRSDVILFGTASEGAVTRAISAELHRPPIDLTEKTAIADLPALLCQCHLFIGNDSGAMHIAAAVGLPVVAVFGPTDPQGTAPVTPRSTIVQQKPYCSP